MKKERTLVILKPDAVQRVLVGEIISRFEKVGLKIVAMKFVKANTNTIEKHYTIDPEWKRKAGEKNIESMKEKGIDVKKTAEEIGNDILNSLKNYISAGPVVAIILEGSSAVPLVRKLVGSTSPIDSDVGTIRGDYVLDSYQLADADGRSIRNLIHASGTKEEADKEISIWFTDTEIHDYETAHEHILYDVNFDNKQE